jgi:hypothetical protein
MKRYDFYPGLFLAVVSIGGCILASRLGLGSMYNPGAGLIPFGTAAILALMSLGMVVGSLIRAAKEKPAQATKIFEGVNWMAATLVLCTLSGYGMAFETLGFDICNFFMMVVLIRAVCRKKLWLTLAISIITVVGAHILFATWLNCQFPRGPFGM